MSDFICMSCEGSGEVKSQLRHPDGSYSDWIPMNCLANGNVDDLRYMLDQFICCKNIEPCKACDFEREEIMNMVWHLLERERK